MSEEQNTSQYEDVTVEVEEVLPEYLAAETTSLAKDLMGLDKSFDRSSNRRERLITKIEKVVDAMDISLGGDSEKLEAQSKMIDVYARLLRDDEDNGYKRASIKLRQKQDEAINGMCGSITQVLQNIDMRSDSMVGFNLTEEEQQRLLANQFESRGCVVISTQELEADPTSVHHLSAILRDEATTAREEQIQKNK